MLISATSVLAQIPYVTVRTPRSPGPPMALVRSNPPPVAASQAANVVRIIPPRVQNNPSLGKDELDRRVVAFQKQRAQEGSPSAQYELGLRYLKGQGVEKDLPTARKWLTLAADAGNAEAQKKLLEIPKHTFKSPAREHDQALEQDQVNGDTGKTRP